MYSESDLDLPPAPAVIACGTEPSSPPCALEAGHFPPAHRGAMDGFALLAMTGGGRVAIPGLRTPQAALRGPISSSLSPPRKRGSRGHATRLCPWVPAFAGMTG